MTAAQPIAFVNARLIDPESGYDGPGCLLARDGVIAEVRRSPTFDSRPAEASIRAYTSGVASRSVARPAATESGLPDRVPAW